MPELTGSDLAFKVKFLVDKPNTWPRSENSILKKFIFVWLCYMLYQNQLQMFKIAKLLKMCLMLLHVKAFSKTIIMSINRVSGLTGGSLQG